MVSRKRRLKQKSKVKKLNIKITPQLLLKIFIGTLVFLFVLFRFREQVIKIVFTVIIIGINAGLGFITSKVRGINFEIFSIGCAFFLTFFDGGLRVFFLIVMLVSYFIFSEFNFWALPYFISVSVTFLMALLFKPTPSAFFMTAIVLFFNSLTYVIFAFFHGDFTRPLKDTVIAFSMNLVLLNIFMPLLLMI
ncbi:MAG: hypothetical protein KKF44_07775 [Nanoarchaeota archaeon]|nr:hypothetical protein [Nanoarchaeota archaeon]